MTETDPVDAHAGRQLARLAATPELGSLASDPALQQRLRQLAVASDFAIETLLRQPDLRRALAATGDFPDLPAPALEPDQRADWPARLRRFRTAASARLAWRDVSGRDDVDATLVGSTRLAEACLQAGLEAMAVFSTSFLMRPIGAWFFGRYRWRPWARSTRTTSTVWCAGTAESWVCPSWPAGPWRSASRDPELP